MSTSNAQIQCNSSSTPGTASTRREATGCRSSYSPGSKTVPHSPAAPIMAALSVQYLSGGRAVCTPSSSPSSATLRRRSESAPTPPTTATEDTLARSAAVLSRCTSGRTSASRYAAATSGALSLLSSSLKSLSRWYSAVFTPENEKSSVLSPSSPTGRLKEFARPLAANSSSCCLLYTSPSPRDGLL